MSVRNVIGPVIAILDDVNAAGDSVRNIIGFVVVVPSAAGIFVTKIVGVSLFVVRTVGAVQSVGGIVTIDFAVAWTVGVDLRRVGWGKVGGALHPWSFPAEFHSTVAGWQVDAQNGPCLSSSGSGGKVQPAP